LEALNQFSLEKPIELVGEDLRYTAREIGRITGKIDVEDILDKLFSSFCIGK
jgi:tRNA modification GTPase